MLARIRNASMRGKSTVRTPASKIRRWVLDVLQAEGYIRGYEEVTTDAGHKEIEISLKYYDGQPVIRELAGSPPPAAASTPASRTCRRSARASASPSSPRRRASCPTQQARTANVGGEVLCTVF
jgi:small subunit ribosomal protein S8